MKRTSSRVPTILCSILLAILTATSSSGQEKATSLADLNAVVSSEQPIANGLESFSFPTTAAIVGARFGDHICTATLTGCSTVVTAAHCLCETDGADCSRGRNVAAPRDLQVYLQNAGLFDVSRVEIHPDYEFGFQSDVAVLELSRPVEGIEPTPLLRGGQPSSGTRASIVGFGISQENRDDSGIKRSGRVSIRACEGVDDREHLCWLYTGATQAAGRVSNTCPGDSGGPLFITQGGRSALAGVTSGGSGPCHVNDEAFDADISANRAWIEQVSRGDLGARTCSALPKVGGDDVRVNGSVGNLSSNRPRANHRIEVPPGAERLVVGLSAEEGPFDQPFELDLSVSRNGQTECRSRRPGVYESCTIENPEPGTWTLTAQRTAGRPRYQLSSTVFGATGQPVSTEPCRASASKLCLGDGANTNRFSLTMDVDSRQGGGLQTEAKARPLAGLGVEDGGLFWFVDPGNPEALVKVLDACAVNGHFWVFAAAATDLGFELEVIDTASGRSRRYQNPDGQRAQAIADTQAFACR